MRHLYIKLSRALLWLPHPLRWLGRVVLLAALSLLATLLLGSMGLFYEAELQLVQILANHPFYMTAEEAQQSFLSDDSITCLCAMLALYYSAILLRERRAGVQCAIVTLSLLILLVACLCAVFWGGILNMSAPITCLLLCWAFTSSTQLITQLFQGATKPPTHPQG